MKKLVRQAGAVLVSLALLAAAPEIGFYSALAGSMSQSGRTAVHATVPVLVTAPLLGQTGTGKTGTGQISETHAPGSVQIVVPAIEGTKEAPVPEVAAIRAGLTNVRDFAEVLSASPVSAAAAPDLQALRSVAGPVQGTQAKGAAAAADAYKGKITFDGADQKARTDGTLTPVLPDGASAKKGVSLKPASKSIPAAKAAAAVEAGGKAMSQTQPKGLLGRIRAAASSLVQKAVVGARLAGSTFKAVAGRGGRRAAVTAAGIMAALFMASCGGGGSDGGSWYTEVDVVVSPFYYPLTQEQIQEDMARAVPFSDYFYTGTESYYDGSVPYSSYDDAFRMDLAQDGQIHFHVHGVPGSELDLRLVDYWGREMARSEDTGFTGNEATVSATVPWGSYYLIVHNKRNTGVGQVYSARFALQPSQPDPYSAIPIDPHGAVTGTVGDSQSDALFRVDTDRDGYLDLYLYGVYGAEFELRLLDWAGNEIARSNDFPLPGDSASVGAYVYYGNTYYIQIHNRNDGGVGQSYQMNASLP